MPSLSKSTIEPRGTNSVLATRRPSWTALPEPEPRRAPKSRSKRRSRTNDEHSTPGLSVDWPGTSHSLSRTRRPSFGPSTPGKSLLEDGRSDDVVVPEILDSPEEGKGFRSSWEINVKKLVGDAVGNVNLIYYVERPGNLMNTTSLDEYKSYFARHRSCSVRCHLSSRLLCSTNNMIGEEGFS